MLFKNILTNVLKECCLDSRYVVLWLWWTRSKKLYSAWSTICKSKPMHRKKTGIIEKAFNLIHNLGWIREHLHLYVLSTCSHLVLVRRYKSHKRMTYEDEWEELIKELLSTRPLHSQFKECFCSNVEAPTPIVSRLCGQPGHELEEDIHPRRGPRLGIGAVP